MGQPALQKFHPVETLPGEQIRSDDDQALAKAAGDIGTTIFHPVGTAKMGLTSDPNAVVDARLSRPGIEGFSAGPSPNGPTLRTFLPPVINNRSLYVNPQRHSFKTRGEDKFPALLS